MFDYGPDISTSKFQVSILAIDSGLAEFYCNVCFSIAFYYYYHYYYYITRYINPKKAKQPGIKTNRQGYYREPVQK